MEEEKKKRRRWRDIPLATKMILAVGSIMVMMLVINMILYEQVNKTIRRMDTVYSSNVDLTDLSASLENVQQALYSYLSVKTSDSLENYYRCEQDYRYLGKSKQSDFFQSHKTSGTEYQADVRNLSVSYRGRSCGQKRT